MTGSALVWLRDDLRLADNPALEAARAGGRAITLLFVLDDVSPGIRPIGAAARWWLHHSLAELSADVTARGGRLVLRRGAAADVVATVAAEIRADAVFWNRRYGAAERVVDAETTRRLVAAGRRVSEHSGASLLWEPDAIRTGAGAPFRVFTPFFRAARAAPRPRLPVRAPTPLRAPETAPASDRLDAWGLRPTAPDWSGGLAATWTPGEAGAAVRLTEFLRVGLFSYAQHRDRPDLSAVSRLSPHLRFGEISPHMVLAAIEAQANAPVPPPAAAREKFFAELGWREFSHHLLFHFPELDRRNFQPRFDAFPWREDPAFLAAWQAGRTGYPLVDAGLRQLWSTGWMHNRVRMVAASFLVKHGLVDWRAGEAWFWDTLVDACPANNPAGWQWVAGSGADAAPFFRIFNPIGQGEKFDPDGAYVRRWVPELAGLPTAAIHAPWTASPLERAAAGVRAGETYPHPIVDHAVARARALAAFAALQEIGERGGGRADRID